MSECIEKLSCEEHIDIAIDEYIDQYETFPTLHKADDGKCDYCNLKALYKVNNKS